MKPKVLQRTAARELRASRVPLGIIAARLGVAKSSVSVWVRDVPVPPGAPYWRGSVVTRTVARPPDAGPVRRVVIWRSGAAKRCSRCGNVLPVESFNRHGDGWQSYCRECFRQYFAARGDLHRRQSGAALRVRKRRSRPYVLEMLLTRRCVDCGERDPVVLEFDHIKEKKRVIAELVADGVPLARIAEEIERCEVVCVNCHRHRTAERAGWLRSSRAWRVDVGRLSPAVAANIAFVYDRLEHLGCVDCGEADIVPLDFDHEGAKRFSVMWAAWHGAPLAELQREVSTCAVRCGNCHRRRTAERGGHYRPGAAR